MCHIGKRNIYLYAGVYIWDDLRMHNKFKCLYSIIYKLRRKILLNAYKVFDIKIASSYLIIETLF